MGVLAGSVIVALSLLAWAGQAVSWFAPSAAVRWGLAESDANVEPAFAADGRGEALWDICTLWTMVVAGILLVVDHESWAYFGLVGGGMYLYFAGRGILTRMALSRRGLRIGSPSNVRVGFAFLGVWGAMGVATIAAAVVALPID